MKRFLLLAVLALSLSANLAVAAMALSRRAPVRGGTPMLFAMVDLDAAQREAISRLRERLLASRDEHARQLAGLRGRLGAAMSAQPLDRAAVDAALREIALVQDGYQREVVEHVLAVGSLLRPEQRQAFERMVEAHMAAGDVLRGAAACPAPEEH